MNMKPGIKSTEFWLSLAASIAVVALPAIQGALEVDLGESHWAVAAVALVYNVVRYLVKRDDLKAKTEVVLNSAPLAEKEPREA
jgi:hypothetical protein